MCKIFSMTNLNRVYVNPKLISVIKKEVCGYGDKDGFGYAVLTDTGDLFGEKTISPHWFEPMIGSSRSKIDQLPLTAKNGEKFGRLQGKPKSLIAHGRASTNTISVANTHPFVGDGIAMVHNGIVHDSGQMLNASDLKTDNDTEIAFRYWQLEGMKGVEENVSGYYAFAVLDQKTKLLHIAKDDAAKLFCVYSPTVDSYMFATTTEILKGIAKKMKWKLEEIRPVLSNIYGVFDGNTCVESRVISPLAHVTRYYGGSYESGYRDWRGSSESAGDVEKSLGYNPNAPESEPVPEHKESEIKHSETCVCHKCLEAATKDEVSESIASDIGDERYWDRLSGDDGPMATDEFMMANRAVLRKLRG